MLDRVGLEKAGRAVWASKEMTFFRNNMNCRSKLGKYRHAQTTPFWSLSLYSCRGWRLQSASRKIEWRHEAEVELRQKGGPHFVVSNVGLSGSWHWKALPSWADHDLWFWMSQRVVWTANISASFLKLFGFIDVWTFWYAAATSLLTQDPFSRRAVWELLRSMKQGRVTVRTPSEGHSAHFRMSANCEKKT